MLQAVHSDRSGRVFVSADYGATALDGPSPAALERAIPLPAEAQLVPLADRAAIGLDRRAQPRSLGPAGWALAAVLRPGQWRTRLPSVETAPDAAPLEPLAYAAVAADPRGELVVAAITIAPVTTPDGPDASAAINARLRAEPSNRLLRQLARCARDYGCAAARNTFLGRAECALPLGAPANDEAAPVVALRRRDEHAPPDPAALREAAARRLAITIELLALPGLTDREGEVTALIALLGELPPGTELRIADLAADPYAVLARVAGGATMGVDGMLDRLRSDAAH